MGHLAREREAAQEVPQIVGQHEQGKAYPVGEYFDPEEFSPDEVEFDNPDKRRLESMLFD